MWTYPEPWRAPGPHATTLDPAAQRSAAGARLSHDPRPAFRVVRSGGCALALFVSLLAIAGLSGCTSIGDYIHNGFKVGPNYKTPPAPVADTWIDAADKRVRTETDDLSKWWTVFNDPALNDLIFVAYHQNLTLREAGWRVLQARAQWGIAVGEIMPQAQFASGSYNWNVVSRQTANSHFVSTKRFFGQWNGGFNLAWELDFWGRFRRAIESTGASLDASVEDYDDVLVTLLSDVATNYVLMRTTEERIRYAKENVDVQRKTLGIAQARFKAGTVRELDVDQAETVLYQTEATIPELEITLRQATDQLCILLGIPPEELRAKLGRARIPTAPVDVAVGIPADLLRRRPDVRRAERQAAAQSAQIGVAEADFYPSISLTGTIGWQAEFFKDLLRDTSTAGAFGPSFQWKILNFGRILNNVRYQDAKFQELVNAYQQQVLTAQQEVEDGLITFLKAQQSTALQEKSVKAAEKAVKVILGQYDAGLVDFTRVTQLELILVQEQDALAQAQGQIPTGLIQVYKALGGGWQIRCEKDDPSTGASAAPCPVAAVSVDAPPRTDAGSAPATQPK
jgi:NodT family efflux transporter outer membrane factor (OMF) lipoprotein